MAYGRGWGLLLNNMCRYKKKIRRNIFSLVWNFAHENFSSNHFVRPGKKIQYLDVSILAAGPLITVPLKFGEYLILYSQERNMRIAGYRL